MSLYIRLTQTLFGKLYIKYIKAIGGGRKLWI